MPGKPGRPEVDKVSSREVSLHWVAPDNDGGAKITHYIIHYGTVNTDLDKFEKQRVIASQTNCTISKWIRFNKIYKFAVVAENQEGLGPLSDFSEYIRTPNRAGNLHIAVRLSCLLTCNEDDRHYKHTVLLSTMKSSEVIC